MKQEELRELSALIDNEAETQVMVKISRRLSHDEETLQTLVRYQMIGECLRGERPEPRAAEMVKAVSRRLEEEPTVLAPSIGKHRRSWLRPVAGAAIAASVAAVGVMVLPRALNHASTEIPAVSQPAFPVAAQQVAYPVSRPVVIDLDDARWRTINDTARERLLERYLEQHSRYATQSGLQRMIPYTTLVSYGNASGVPDE